MISKLNKVFDHRVRLGIMSILMVQDWVEFKRFKELLELTDGNLASHVAALEKEQYILIKKDFVGKKPRTRFKASALGKVHFKKHVDALEAILKNSK